MRSLGIAPLEETDRSHGDLENSRQTFFLKMQVEPLLSACCLTTCCLPPQTTPHKPIPEVSVLLADSLSQDHELNNLFFMHYSVSGIL